MEEGRSTNVDLGADILKEQWQRRNKVPSRMITNSERAKGGRRSEKRNMKDGFRLENSSG